MRTFAAAIALAFSCSAATAATEADVRLFQLEATAPADCAAPAAGQGQPIEVQDTLDPDAQAALAAGVFLALHDPSGAGTWPVADIGAAGPCRLARFEADGVVWTISGADGRAPPRWMQAPGREGVFYVARGPALPDALAWSRTRQGLPPSTQPPAYYLAGTTAGEHYVFRIYDSLPDTRRLADDLSALLETQAPPLAVLAAGDAVTLFRETTSGVYAEIFRPGAITPDRPAKLYGADGRFFSGGFGEDWRLRGSGFVCPAAFGAFERAYGAILNPSEEAMDVSCGYATEESFITIFVSRAPDVRGDKAYFASVISDTEGALEQPRKLKDPPTGRKWPIQAGRAWVDKAGLMQEVMLMRRGEHIVELRGTYILDDVQAAGETLIKLIELLPPPS